MFKFMFTLTSEELETLKTAIAQDDDLALKQRATALYLAAHDVDPDLIATAHGISMMTLQDWRCCFAKGGLDRLANKPYIEPLECLCQAMGISLD